MVWMSRFATSPRARSRSAAKSLAWLLVAFAASGAACSSDDDGQSTSTMEPGTCEGGGGPVTSTAAEEDHCAAGAQKVGMCRSAAADDDAAADEEEEHETNTGNEAADDDCKYHVSFSNTCIRLNEPVTFTVKLDTLSDGKPAKGAEPSNPEIFLEEGNHPSPSNDIRATEGPDGTYKIGPIVFDRSGRWVVRWHFFEDCSDIPEDSPHGHVAFYIDVP
jgi:hypothetical protein